MSKNDIRFRSLCVKEYRDNKSTKPHQLPIYATSSFSFDSVEQGIDIFTGKEKGHVYGRYGNPTIDTVGQKLADLEAFGTDLDAWAFLTSSGMSAISTLTLSLLKAGDKILTQGNLYGGTTELFTKVISQSGIQTIFVDLSDDEKWVQLLKNDKNIKLIYLETPANPTLACVDIEKIAKIASGFGVLTCIDNTFCTPYLQRPLALGVDFVIHSTTKYLNGHGNAITGVIVGAGEQYKKKIWTTLKLLGTTCNPFDAWLVNNGLKTLALRMDRHGENAMKLSQFLENHPSVAKVNYCGLKSHPSYEIATKQMSQYGGMMSFELKGGLQPALKLMNSLNLATNAPTLGDVDTLILHPATSSHLNVDKILREANGISDGLIRVSVGIEDIQDIIQDFENALSMI